MLGNTAEVLEEVSWPSPIDGVAIRGWHYEAGVSAERVVEVAPYPEQEGSGEKGSRRWVEWSLGRRAVADALEQLGVGSGVVVVDDRGAPHLADRSVGISISHTSRLVLAAAGHGAVGIDVEPADRDVTRLERALLPGETDISTSLGLLETLVVKEAAAKLTGDGLGGSLARWPVLDVELFGQQPAVAVGTPSGEVISARVWERQGFVVALAFSPNA